MSHALEHFLRYIRCIELSNCKGVPYEPTDEGQLQRLLSLSIWTEERFRDGEGDCVVMNYGGPGFAATTSALAEGNERYGLGLVIDLDFHAEIVTRFRYIANAAPYPGEMGISYQCRPSSQGQRDDGHQEC